MLTHTQFNTVTFLLWQRLPGNFAFCVINGQTPNDPHTILYAEDSGSWSCIVNLVQGMAAIGCTLDDGYIYIPQNTPYNGAAEGMCSLFNITVGTVVSAGSNGVLRQRGSVGYLSNQPYARFVRVNPDDILRRNALDPFLNLNLGPNPQAPLQSVHQTHLHRIYMALAFRRVQRKFTNYESGLAIAAVLVNSGDGRIRAIAHNTKSSNTTNHHHNATSHAEVNLVQAFLKNHAGERDGQFVIYTTLQPCPMCAAMIAEQLPNAMVLYGQNDSGGHMNRMKSKPQICFALQDNLQVEDKIDDDISQIYSVKPLRGYSATPQQGVLGANTFPDVVNYLDNQHSAWRNKGEYALTRNLYKPELKQGINQASKTIDRKVQQYHHNHKPTVVPNDQFRTQRRQAIQNVIEHIHPLLTSI